MARTIHQPKHRKTSRPSSSDAIVLQFPGSDPISDPDPWTQALTQERTARGLPSPARSGPALVRDRSVRAILNAAIP